MHYNGEIYEDPFLFKPTRWLANDYSKSAHGTFGGGSHICLGMNFSRIQMPLITGYLLSNYDFEVTKAPTMETTPIPGKSTLRRSG